MAQVHQFHLRREQASGPYVTLRAQLIGARKAAGITQQELADRIGRPQSFVAKVERGERSLDVVEFVAVTAILGMDAGLVVERVAEELAQE